MKTLFSAALLLCCSLFLSGQSGPAWSKKISPSLLDKTRDGQSTPFIILMREQADVSAAAKMDSKEEKGNYVFQTLYQTATASQAEIRRLLEDAHIAYEPLYIANLIKTEGDLTLLQSLAQRREVALLIDNPTVHFPQPEEWKGEDESSTRSAVEWGIERIQADDVWALGYRGQGVVVGGEDTGYEWTHPALKKKYRGYDEVLDTADHNYNWHDAIHAISPLNADSLNPCGLNTQAPCDDHSHGTHTMGTMIGEDGENQIGVAPDAKWCGCRNMERGWGSPFTYLECFQWFLAPTDLNNENPDPAKAPHVINNSWGCPEIEGCDSTNWVLLEIAVNNLRQAGTVVVVSAGNDGPGCSSVQTPAAIFSNSFSIGATAFNDTIAGFSSRGAVSADASNRLKPNVSAPGVSIRSARLGGQYGNSSGTNMAGPHVAGLVALIISANPDLAGKVDLIEDIIEQTAIPKTTDQSCGDIPGSEVPNNTYGYGRVDALAAVQAAIALIPTSIGDENVKPQVHVYPNPVDNQLMFASTANLGDVHLDIYDIQGRLMETHQWNADAQGFARIDFSGKPAGLYFYSMRSNAGFQTGKVVKK